jgi:imidazolonepropionase-like amidohydrolase
MNALIARVRIVACVAAALAVEATAVGSQTQSSVLAIEHVTVLPMTRDTALVDHTVLVRDDRIVWVGRSSDARIPGSARRVNGRGKFLIPGLADMHVHVRSTQHLSQFLAAGVTTVRNMNGGPEHVAWRERINSGTLAGPTIFTAGPPLGQYRINPDPRFTGLRTPADAEEVVRQQTGAGYDMVKVIQRISPPVYDHLVKIARAARMPVVGHVIPGIGLERSLSAGQVSVEHVDGLRNRSRVASLFGADESGFDEDARAIARHGAWVGTIASSRTGGCEPPTGAVRRSIASLRRARVKILAGSDAGIGPVQPASGLHCELATLVAAGMTPYEALATATVNTGAFARAHLRRAQVPFGTVTPGARADLVLLAGDPRADIRVLVQPISVVVRGALAERSASEADKTAAPRGRP